MLNRRCKSYTFAEYRALSQDDNYSLVEKILEHIKTNKVAYAKLVFLTASLIHFNMNFIFANDFNTSLDAAGTQILDLLTSVAKWGCIGFGIKDMTVTVLNGGNIKDAINNGLLYIIAYIFISLYPQLFDLFSKIKF